LERRSWYYQPVGPSAEDVELMRWLDEQYTATPFYGIRRMTAWLRSRSYVVNHKRVGRLLRQMGLEAIYPKPRLSQPAAGHVIYPYLLRGITVNRVNQVWSADITYVRLAGGFVYLVAVIDWFSRYVLSWAVSITMDVACCVVGTGFHLYLVMDTQHHRRKERTSPLWLSRLNVVSPSSSRLG
jgi:putative transposase